MRRRHDGFILAFTLIPLALAVWAFFVWRSTGSVPLPFSFADLPTVNLPSIPIPQVQFPLPENSQQAENWFGKNAWALVFGVALGGVAGMIAVGTLADGFRIVGRFFGRRKPVQEVVNAEDGAEIP